MEKKKVRFIRKNGKVIPIREKKRKLSGGELLVGGIGVNVGAMGLGNAISKRAEGKPRTSVSAFKKNYAKFYDKAGRPDIFNNPNLKGAFAYNSNYVGRQTSEALAPILGVGLKRRSVILGTMANEDTLLHEMGHLAATRKKGTMNRFLRSITVRSEQLVKKGKLGTVFNMNIGIGTVRPFTDVVSEAEANYFASRAVKARSGRAAAAKYLIRTFPAYSTYLARAVGTGMQYAGINRIAKDLSKGGQE
jgi:hypothetical protein